MKNSPTEANAFKVLELMRSDPDEFLAIQAIANNIRRAGVAEFDAESEFDKLSSPDENDSLATGE
jgi:hypothetical protein